MTTKFKLTLDDQVFSDSEITIELIVNSLFAIENDDITFMILEPRNPIKNSLYIQVVVNFVIEIRFILSDGTMRHYSYYSEDIEEVKTVFLNYFEKSNIPTINTDWEDITNSFRTSRFSTIIQNIKKFIFK